MQIINESGVYVLTCDKDELALIAEGLYAVEDAGKRCLAEGVPDAVNRPQLEGELHEIGQMRLMLQAVFGERPVFHIIDGGR